MKSSPTPTFVADCLRTLLLSIAAPYIQVSGTRDGFLINPRNGAVLLNSTGFKEALRVWQQLWELMSPQDVNASCRGGPDSFAEGACLMTVQAFDKFKVRAGHGMVAAGGRGEGGGHSGTSPQLPGGSTRLI